jgi:hypothetical protein
VNRGDLCPIVKGDMKRQGRIDRNPPTRVAAALTELARAHPICAPRR